MKQTPWLLSPVIDILFACGGAVWIVAGILWWRNHTTPYWQFQAEYPIYFVAFLIAHFLANPHTSATYYRIYGSEEARQKWRFFARWLPIPFLLLLIWGVAHPRSGPAFARWYTILVMPHWMGQIYGVGLIYCYRQNYRFGPLEKRLYWGMLQMVGVLVVLRSFLPQYGAPFFIVQTPNWGFAPYWTYDVAVAIFTIVTACFLLAALRKWIVDKEKMPLPAVLLTLTGIFIQIPDSPFLEHAKYYVIGFFHGSQYLVVCAAYYLREHRPATTPPEKVGRLLWSPLGLKYWATNIAGGFLLYFGISKLIEDFFRVPFAQSFPIVFGVINFHHFIVDAAIWKLRKPEIRSVLLPRWFSPRREREPRRGLPLAVMTETAPA